MNSKMNSTWPLLLYPNKAVLIEQEVEHTHCDHAPLVTQGLHHVAHQPTFLKLSLVPSKEAFSWAAFSGVLISSADWM